MQRSIEARSPFLDHELFDYTNRLPKNIKIKNNTSKIILRKFLKINLNNNTYKNAKKGFTVPIAYWLQNELKGVVIDSLSRNKIEKLNLFSYDYFQNSVMNPHLNGIKNNHKKICNLFVLMKWIDKNIN